MIWKHGNDTLPEEGKEFSTINMTCYVNISLQIALDKQLIGQKIAP